MVEEIEVFECQEIGHTKRFCPKKKKREKEQEESKGEVAVVQDGYDISKVLVVSINDTDKNWIMDSSCSFHMTPNKGWFETLNEFDGGQVMLGNNKCCEIKGVGTVRIKFHDGIERVLSQVRYIPSLRRNLISLGT